MSEQHSIDFNTSIQYLKGVGPRRAAVFERLGINTAGDLLDYFPRDWSFAPQSEPINMMNLKIGQDITISGLIESIDYISHRAKPMLEVYVADKSGMCRIVWFNGGYLMKQFDVGMFITAWGRVGMYKHTLMLTNPKFKISEKPIELDNGEQLGGAIYPATADISSGQIQKIILPILDGLCENIEEFFQEQFLKHRLLIPRKMAYRWIHSGENDEQIRAAKRRLKYDELFLMQAGLALKRYKLKHLAKAVSIQINDEIDSRIRRRFPFLLTEDQNTVISEIIADMGKTFPMNRLLQGDVGSGKTVVALYAALAAVANKTQAAIMAPTEILANQHHLSIERYLKNSRVRRAVLTGSKTAKQKKIIYEKVKAGEIDILVGTVALLNEQIEFNNLGLVVIDEQHKFGVNQRAMLKKENFPHCLVMTATPIPRTLAMTAFGDLDLSIIKHRPPGRGKVVTKIVQPHNRMAAYDFITQRLKARKQAYFVYPRISNLEDNEQIKAAVDEYQKLANEYFKDFNVQLLHGQMNAEAKAVVMDEFRRGKVDVLVSTLVIEVGVDVPNATMMVIETADRFGLAQLHQLRGRIGRGESNSYCFLFTETDNETASKRLDIMVRTNDGFEIAEEDLRIRGPGELFSTRQHGLPDLKIADIVEDFELLQMSRRDAFALIESDPLLDNQEHSNIRKGLIEKFQTRLNLADIA